VSDLARGPRRLVSTIVIEPNRLVLEALRHVLGADPEIAIVATAPTVAAAPLRRLQPDVVVLDLDELRDVALEAALAACGSASPRSRVCALSMHHSTRLMTRALDADAAAYVVKDTTPERFAEIIHALAAGEDYADPRLAGALLRERFSRAGHGLTAREGEIVRLVAEGLTNREIGRRLAVTEKTVKNHVGSVLVKLKVSARAAIAVYAVRNGLIA